VAGVLRSRIYSTAKRAQVLIFRFNSEKNVCKFFFDKILQTLRPSPAAARLHPREYPDTSDHQSPASGF
jgi:hypothetical protein